MAVRAAVRLFPAQIIATTAMQPPGPVSLSPRAKASSRPARAITASLLPVRPTASSRRATALLPRVTDSSRPVRAMGSLRRTNHRRIHRPKSEVMPAGGRPPAVPRVMKWVAARNETPFHPDSPVESGHRCPPRRWQSMPINHGAESGLWIFFYDWA